MRGWLLVTTCFLLPAAAPPARTVLGACLGVDGVVGWVAIATPTPSTDKVKWELLLQQVGKGGARVPSRGTAEANVDTDFIPASPTVSWRDLDDGSQLIWTNEASIIVNPSTGLSPASIETASGPCEGVAWSPSDGAASGPRAVLLVPAEALAITIDDDGKVKGAPLVQPPPPRGARRKRGEIAPPADLDGQARIERTDVKDLAGATVGSAWRMVITPSHVAGRLKSDATAIVTRNNQRWALHRITGVLELESGPGEIHGALMERLP